VTILSSDILDALPHRPPFRFLSEIVTLQAGESGEAVWRVTGTEPFFEGHFPRQPIVPGVLIAEALAQLSGLVGFYRGPKGTRGVGDDGGGGRLAHVDLRFKDAVMPPAEVALQARLVRTFGSLRQFEVTARCGQTVVAAGRLTLAHTLPGAEAVP